ncbi:MAG: hypothetical protein AAF171_13650 [Cyanobacteria bacterium P01_A01_bin.116]
MSINDLNHFMTYVIEGWMLFSAGFIGTTFVSFVSRRIQEDIEAAALAEGLTEEVSEALTVTEAVEAAVVESAKAESASASPAAPIASEPNAENPSPPNSSPQPDDSATGDGDEKLGDELGGNEPVDDLSVEEQEAARLDEVAAVSEQLSKNRGKQADSSSVSVST